MSLVSSPSRQPLIKTLFYLVGYGLWNELFRLLIITLVTFFLRSTHPGIQKLGEILGSYELYSLMIGSVLFVLFLCLLNPLTSTTYEEVFTPERFEGRFLSGFLQGSGISFGFTLAFLLSGFLTYLGLLIRLEEAPLNMIAILFRIGLLGLFIYCEEFIFRHKIYNYLRSYFSDFQTILVVGVLYCGMKRLQFDLGIMHLITLFLISVSMGLRTLNDQDFVKGAGFWAGILIIFHPLLSLPIFGQEFQGVLLLKYQAPQNLNPETVRIITGGVGGPLASCSLQLLLLIDIFKIFRQVFKKNKHRHPKNKTKENL